MRNWPEWSATPLPRRFRSSAAKAEAERIERRRHRALAPRHRFIEPLGVWEMAPVLSPEAAEAANELGVPLYVISRDDFMQLAIRAIETGNDLLSTIVNARKEMMAAATDTTGMDRQ